MRTRGTWAAIASLAGRQHGVVARWLGPGGGPRAHVTIARKRRSSPRIVYHCAALERDEVTFVDGIPATVPMRTAADLAPALPSPALARMLEAAEMRKVEFGPAPERYAGRPGAPRLRAALRAAPAMTRSDFEARVIAKIEAAGLPRPLVNTLVEGYEVDLAWPEHGVIAELDAYATHGTSFAFERDRERDRKLTAAGWRVMRLTDAQADAALSDLASLLGARAA